jgi:hypothetical protein
LRLAIFWAAMKTEALRSIDSKERDMMSFANIINLQKAFEIPAG